MEKVRAPGSEAARDMWFLLQEKLVFCQKSRTSCFFKENVDFLKKICLRQRSCPGQVVSSKKQIFWKKSSVPGSEAAQDKWYLLQKNQSFWEKVLPRQRSCPGQVACSRKVMFPEKSPAPGSEAARDKWLVQKRNHFFKNITAPSNEAAQDK